MIRIEPATDVAKSAVVAGPYLDAGCALTYAVPETITLAESDMKFHPSRAARISTDIWRLLADSGRTPPMWPLIC